MRFFMTSFATLLALVAFAARTMAKDPGGDHGKGHAGAGQPSVVQPGTASTGHQHEAGTNPARTRDAGTNSQQSAGANGNVSAPRSIPENRSAQQGAGGQVNRQFAAGAGVAATPDSWRYRSDNGRWWYWTPQNHWMLYGDDGRWMDYQAESYSAATNAYVGQRPIVVNFSGSAITISNPATNTATLSYTLDGYWYSIPPGHSQDFREDRAWVIQFSRGENLDQARYGLQSGRYTFTSTDHGWELYRSELP